MTAAAVAIVVSGVLQLVLVQFGQEFGALAVQVDVALQFLIDIVDFLVVDQRGDFSLLQRFGKEGRQLISCGGGIVKKPENLRALHQNGIIFWLKRDIDQLPREGRPLSAGDLAAMYDRRKACYERFADHIVDNNGTVEDTVQAILDCLK